MGTTNESRETDICKDLNFSTCVKCGHVQLSNLIPLEALYEKSHNAAVGKTWDRHHLEFYEFIKKYAKRRFSCAYTFFFYKKVCKRVGAKTFLNFWTFWG